MGRKSLLVRMEITEAGRAHDCRYNKRHRIAKGVRRLTVRSKDGDKHHYCLSCAKEFVAHSLDDLMKLRDAVNAAGN